LDRIVTPTVPFAELPRAFAPYRDGAVTGRWSRFASGPTVSRPRAFDSQCHFVVQTPTMWTEGQCPDGRISSGETVRRAGLALALLCALAACGGDQSLPDPGPSSGLDPNEPLVSITADQLDLLCHWSAGRFGGWGRRVTCANGDYLTGPVNEAACGQMSSMFSMNPVLCTETLSDFEACVNGVTTTHSCIALPGICFELVVDCGMPR
jgi:hypothetical protein